MFILKAVIGIEASWAQDKTTKKMFKGLLKLSTAQHVRN